MNSRLTHITGIVWRMEGVEDGNEENNSVSRRLLCYNLKLVRNMTKIKNS